MSRRNANYQWSTYAGGFAAAAGATGLGYALYRGGDDETNPVNAVLSRVSPCARRSTPEPPRYSPCNTRSNEPERVSPCYRRSPQYERVSPCSRNQTPRGKSGGGCQLCYVCNSGIGAGHALILPCCHTFHESCIAANYAYKVLSQHISPGSYSCPACGTLVTEEVIEMIENITMDENDFDENIGSTRVQRSSVCGGGYSNYY